MQTMEEDSIMDFFSSEGYITFDKEAICTTKDLYEAYEIWDERNSVKPRTENSFARDVKQRAPKLGIEYLKNAAFLDALIFLLALLKNMRMQYWCQSFHCYAG